MDGWMDRWTDEQTDKQMDGQTDGWMDGQGCCLTGAQQPGAPKKVLWAPNFLQQLPKHYLLGS